ncbi:MAG: SMP-30/gluconolactonase/LRE family protein [Pseudomonadota bacterium]
MKKSAIWLIFPILILMSACGGESPTPILGCEPSARITPDCRFKNPEDIVLLPSGNAVLISQFGAMDGSKSGNIAHYTLSDRNINILYPNEIEHTGGWGEPECEVPDANAFSPHGIDLEQRDDGTWMLLVVNHGLRESIEFFEVESNRILTWRGCVEGPENAYFNDVVGRPDGGFWVTHMMTKEDEGSEMLKGYLFGSDTGFVYNWRQETGFEKVTGSDGPFPNGIEKSEDESFLFINMYLGNEVRKLDVQSGRIVRTAPVAQPDNTTWSLDGESLLVASHTDSMTEMGPCQELIEGGCGFEFEIVALNPEDMSRRTILKHRGAPMGGATVATDIGGALILGSFAGDRIAQVPVDMSYRVQTE